MKPGIVADYVFDQFFPCAPIEKHTVLDGFIHQLGTLVKNASAADGVVTDFTVAHI